MDRFNLKQRDSLAFLQSVRECRSAHRHRIHELFKPRAMWVNLAEHL